MSDAEIVTLMSFARRLVSAFKIEGHTQDDLIQECMVAALKAWNKHDQSKGMSLTSFLFDRMRRRLVKLSYRSGIVRIPEYVAVAARRAVSISRESGQDIDEVIGALASQSLHARHGVRKNGPTTHRELSVCIRRAIYLRNVGFDLIHDRLVPQGVTCTDGGE